MEKWRTVPGTLAWARLLRPASWLAGTGIRVTSLRGSFEELIETAEPRFFADQGDDARVVFAVPGWGLATATPLGICQGSR
jgi:hypothetical protein